MACERMDPAHFGSMVRHDMRRAPGTKWVNNGGPRPSECRRLPGRAPARLLGADTAAGGRRRRSHSDIRMRRVLFSAIATQSETPLMGSDGSETGARKRTAKRRAQKGLVRATSSRRRRTKRRTPTSSPQQRQLVRRRRRPPREARSLDRCCRLLAPRIRPRTLPWRAHCVPRGPRPRTSSRARCGPVPPRALASRHRGTGEVNRLARQSRRRGRSERCSAILRLPSPC
jgi:hypothetical protein